MSFDSEFLDMAIKSMIEENSKRSTFTNIFSYISILTALLSAIALAIIVIVEPTDEKYFNKDNSKKLIIQAVKNGASINNIKHIYDARLLKKSHFFLIRMSLLLKITQKTLLYLSFCKTYYLIIIQIVISKLILCIYAI